MKFLFYKPLKLTAAEDQICFWSDTHFGHKCISWSIPIWQVRGFSSLEEHDVGLIERWNAVSDCNSTFFHLGDFIFGFDTVERFKSLIHRLNFAVLYIMPGNHNSGWKQNFEEQSKTVWHINENKKVVFVPNYLEIIANGQPIVLSHYPLVSFNGQAKGSWMLHGHCHSNLYKSEIGPLLYKAKIKDLGVENCPSPITLEELREEFGKYSSNITYDHHTEETRNPF